MKMQPEAGGEELFTVTELAADLGISARTIRFYEAKHLLVPRRVGTTRAYTRHDRARMILILRGKRLGFSLREVKEYLDLYDIDRSKGEQLRMLSAAVQSRIARLEEQRIALEETLAELREIDRQAADAMAAVQRAPVT